MLYWFAPVSQFMPRMSFMAVRSRWLLKLMLLQVHGAATAVQRH